MRVELLVAGAAGIGIRLRAEHVDQFRRYYEEITEWNRRVNLTSITGWEEVQTGHFLDSLTARLALSPAHLESGRLLDLGAGAGLPGVAVKIVFPGVRLALLEATAKKTAFLSHLCDVLGLHDVEVFTGRAEDVAHDSSMREEFDMVLARGVARMSVLAELALPFCRLGGVVVAYKKADVGVELARASRAIETMGGRLREVVEVPSDVVGEPRSLVVIEKCSSTPARYPRRPGTPKKRPLEDG